MANTTFTDEEMQSSARLGAGEHVVTVVAINDKDSTTGNPMHEIVMADKFGREVKEYLMPADNMKWKTASFAKACGFTEDQMKEGIDVPDCFKGLRLQAIGTYKGKRTYKGKEFDNNEFEFFALKGSTNEGGPSFDEDDIPF